VEFDFCDGEAIFSNLQTGGMAFGALFDVGRFCCGVEFFHRLPQSTIVRNREK
jgi:hypothetical protein